MKLLAPVNNFDSTVKQIEAGATEVYLGADTQAFSNFSFSGRGKFNTHGVKICPDSHELKDIVNYAHSHNVTVMYAANMPFLADDPSGMQSFSRLYLDYVEKGIAAGVDSVVVGDLGAILLIRQEGIKVHLTAGTFLETVNKEQVLFLKSLGVDRTVLSYQISMEEIEEISLADIMEIEVFGHFGCSFYDGYCNMKHFFGEGSDAGIGIPCQNSYQLMEGKEAAAQGPILNASLACSICSLQRLEEAGVYAVKLVGRERDSEQNAQITAIYSDFLRQLKESGNYREEFPAMRQKMLPRWWQQGYCKNNLCKYSDNPITRLFVG